MSGAWLDWDGAQLGPAWQGIRRIDITLLPPGGPTFTTIQLTAHLNRDPSGITSQSMAIEGGRHVTDFTLTLVAQSAPGDPDPRVTVAVDRLGDHSTYRLVLLDGGADPVHPFFASAEFVFLIDCERGDCNPHPGVAARAARTRPVVDLLTKDYAGFVALLAERVKVTNPHWADLSAASLERVLVELLSHHADLLSYYQDRVGNEAFLDDATQRHSLHEHGSLLGYDLFDGQGASADVAFLVDRDGTLPAGLSVRARGSSDESRAVFYVPERRRVRHDHGALPIAGFPGAAAAQLPAGAQQALLYGHVEGLEAGQRLALVSNAFTQLLSVTRVEQLLLPGWVARPSDPPPVGAVPVTALHWAERLERAVAPFAGGFRLYGNVVRMLHGAPQIAFWNPIDPAALPRSALVLPLFGPDTVVVGGLLRALHLREGPIAFHRNAAKELLPALEVIVDGDTWDRDDSLDGARSFDLRYTTASEEDGTVWLLFGDGVHGRSVAADPLAGPMAHLEIRYRIGDPVAGNIAAGSLVEMLDPTDAADLSDFHALGTVTPVQVAPGAGGLPAETIDAARFAIPASLHHGPLLRSVALADYAAAAREVEGVARATARALGGIFNTVLVVVDPRGQVELTAKLAADVSMKLEELRMAGREHFVTGPRYVPLEVGLALCVEPGSAPHLVREAVLSALRPGSDLRPGYFHPDRLSFGDDVDLGDLLAHVQRVPGVRQVKALRFRRLLYSDDPDTTPLILLGPTDVARLDADDDYPENGRLSVKVVGIDSDVGESDFALEATP